MYDGAKAIIDSLETNLSLKYLELSKFFYFTLFFIIGSNAITAIKELELVELVLKNENYLQYSFDYYNSSHYS